MRFTKWGGGRHWEFPLQVLGRDGHGVWGGGSTGTRLSRPGNTFDSTHDWVSLFPDGGKAWTASFYDAPDQEVAVFVDMTTEPVRRGDTVNMVDLDLDVVLLRDGSLFVDAAAVLDAVGRGVEPFRSTGARWLRAFQGTS